MFLTNSAVMTIHGVIWYSDNVCMFVDPPLFLNSCKSASMNIVNELSQ